MIELTQDDWKSESATISVAFSAFAIAFSIAFSVTISVAFSIALAVTIAFAINVAIEPVEEITIWYYIFGFPGAVYHHYMKERAP